MPIPHQGNPDRIRYWIAINAAELEGFTYFAAQIMELYRKAFPQDFAP